MADAAAAACADKRRWTVRKSTRKHKKYMARCGSAGPWKHFGDTRYQQYRDSTPLRLYAHLDHLDRRRRQVYQMRHRHDRTVPGSAGWLADTFLWS